MFGLLGFILIFLLLIVLIGVTFVGNIIRMIFGLGRRSPKHYNTSRQASGNYSGTTQSATSTASPKKKIFGDDEGEYVEYEEIPYHNHGM